MDKGYAQALTALKEHIHHTQQQAALAVNTRLLFLYWEIGQFIAVRKTTEGWGAEVIKQLSKDLRAEFPALKGFSVRNLQYMVQFAECYPPDYLRTLSIELPIGRPAVPPDSSDSEGAPFAQTLSAQMDEPLTERRDFYLFISLPVAKITWSHHMMLMDKIKDHEERLYYTQRTIEEGWSVRVLAHKIEQRLYDSQGQLPNNFDSTLPAAQSELAKQTLKDPYIFDFLSIGNAAQERDLENALLREITQFLLELGKGFAFLGQQYHLEVGGKDYYLDLLFFHTQLNCYFIIELKIDDFKPEYAGKLNFYINVADDLLKETHQNATIGLLLCKSANKVVAEYSLRDNNKPMGVATYRLLPKEEQLVELLNRKLK